MTSPTQLLIVEPLNCFVIDPGDRITVTQNILTLAVNAGVQNRGFSQPTGTQQQRATRNFRIFSVPSEPAQERHRGLFVTGRSG
jgi:hypothetical protein